MKKKATPQTLDRDLLTVKETSAYLRCCEMTVFRYIKEGKLTRVQRVPRGKNLVTAASIEKLVNR